MAKVYKFKIRLIGLEDIMWREIEISSLSTVTKLAYTVMASFECKGNHLFYVEYKGQRYELDFGYDHIGENNIDPRSVKLEKLNLEIGYTLFLEYDYGCSWQFNIELISITDMKRGAGTHYPYTIDGQGKGIIEDMFLDELIMLMEEIDRTGEDYLIEENGWTRRWNHNNFNLDIENALLKGEVYKLETIYEYD